MSDMKIAARFRLTVGRLYWNTVRDLELAVKHRGGEISHTESSGFLGKDFFFTADEKGALLFMAGGKALAQRCEDPELFRFFDKNEKAILSAIRSRLINERKQPEKALPDITALINSLEKVTPSSTDARYQADVEKTLQDLEKLNEAMERMTKAADQMEKPAIQNG